MELLANGVCRVILLRIPVQYYHLYPVACIVMTSVGMEI